MYSDTHIQHHGTLIVFQISTDTVFLPNSQGSVKLDYKLELDTVFLPNSQGSVKVDYKLELDTVSFPTARAV